MTFNTPFTELNNIYTVNNAYGYDKIIENDIDITETLAMVGIKIDTSEGADPNANITIAKQIDTFASTNKNNIFYELTLANGNTTIYIPEPLIINADSDVYEYYNVMLGVSLGSHKRPETLHPISAIVKDTIITSIGKNTILNEDGTILSVEPNPSLQVYGKTWMTSSQYNGMLKERSRTRRVKLASSDFSLIDYRKLYEDKCSESKQLNSRIKALELIIQKG